MTGQDWLEKDFYAVLGVPKDADAAAVSERAKGEPERGGALALAGAGVDDEEAFLDGLRRDFGVLHGLALRHLRLVAVGGGVVDLGHGHSGTRWERRA